MATESGHQAINKLVSLVLDVILCNHPLLGVDHLSRCHTSLPSPHPAVSETLDWMSPHGGFLKWGFPQIIHFKRI